MHPVPLVYSVFMSIYARINVPAKLLCCWGKSVRELINRVLQSVSGLDNNPTALLVKREMDKKRCKKLAKVDLCFSVNKFTR